MIVIKNGLLSKYYPSFRQREETQPKPQSVAVLSIDRFFIRKTPYLKRIMDIVLAIICLILFSPIMSFIAVAIKMTSEGPVLFKQDRYGNNINCLGHICRLVSLLETDYRWKKGYRLDKAAHSDLQDDVHRCCPDQKHEDHGYDGQYWR